MEVNNINKGQKGVANLFWKVRYMMDSSVRVLFRVQFSITYLGDETDFITIMICNGKIIKQILYRLL